RIASLRPNGHREILQFFPNQTQFVDDLFSYLVFHIELLNILHSPGRQFFLGRTKAFNPVHKHDKGYISVPCNRKDNWFASRLMQPYLSRLHGLNRSIPKMDYLSGHVENNSCNLGSEYLTK